MSDRLKRTVITVAAAAIGAAALAAGAPHDIVVAGTSALTGLLLGWAHLKTPGT
jgi:hypothetical protein